MKNRLLSLLGATTMVVLFLATGLVSAQSLNFSDVSSNDWFAADVENLVTLGVIDGSQPAYRPADSANRAEMSKLIIEAFDIPLESPQFQTFTDVPTSQWYFKYVETMAMNGIAVGYTDANGNLTENFGPQDPITREQAAKMIILGASLPINQECTAVFSDVTHTMWSYEYVNTLYANSIVEGYEDGTFLPHKNINRAEIARIISKSLTPQAKACS
ncbi:MAG TPA: S-layer homology domain-containing protein [Candidatus Gracilibacteria bacterium]|nr:S-layer homology domain-containing protein [Candidatus Gracilibacteria bacterium]